MKELPGCRADVDAAIVQAVGGHSFSKNMQVGILLGQSLRQRLLVPASVPAAVNPELGFGDVALTAPPRLVPKPRLPEARTECRGLESGAPTQIRTGRAIPRLCPANSRPPTHFYILRISSADKAVRAWHDGPKPCVGIGRNQVTGQGENRP